MNTETGEIYRTPEEIKRAIALHGNDKVVPVSERVAKLIEQGRDLEAQKNEYRVVNNPRPTKAIIQVRPLFKTRVKRSR